MNTTVMTQPDALATAPRWRVVLSVFKLRIGVLIMLTALAGLAATPGPAPEAWKVLVMALAVLCLLFPLVSAFRSRIAAAGG